MLNGLTEEGIGGLVPIARSWLNPPKVRIQTGDFEDRGFDRTERAFVFSRRQTSGMPLDITLDASAESPVVNPALLIRNWNGDSVRVRIDGQVLPAGKDLRAGITHTLDGEDLVVWMRRTSTKPLRITLEAENK